MSTWRLIGGMSALVVLGAPLVWYLWEVLNELLSGVVRADRILFALPVLLLFLGLLYAVSRVVQRWDRPEAPMNEAAR